MRSKKMVWLALGLSGLLLFLLIAIPFVYVASGFAMSKAKSRALVTSQAVYEEAAKKEPNIPRLKSFFDSELAWKEYVHHAKAGRVREVGAMVPYAQILGTPAGCEVRVRRDQWYVENLNIEGAKVRFFSARAEGASGAPEAVTQRMQE